MHATERLEKFAERYRVRIMDPAKAARPGYADTGVEIAAPGKYGEIADMGDLDVSLRLRLRTRRTARRRRKAFPL